MSGEQPPGDGGVPPGLRDMDPGRIEMVRDAIDEHFEAVMDDLFATAEEYEEMGWETVTVRPGDVSIIFDDDLGDHTPIFAVTCPQSAWEPIDEMFEAGVEFTHSEVFRAAIDEAVFLLVVLESEAEETAILYPIYYSILQWGPNFTEGEDARVYTRFRHIDGRAHQVEHADPDLFAPPEDIAQEPEEPGRAGPENTVEEIQQNPPERPERPYEDLSSVSPEQIAELSIEELRAYQPHEFQELNKEQREALNVPRGNTDDE